MEKKKARFPQNNVLSTRMEMFQFKPQTSTPVTYSVKDQIEFLNSCAIEHLQIIQEQLYQIKLQNTAISPFQNENKIKKDKEIKKKEELNKKQFSNTVLCFFLSKYQSQKWVLIFL